MMDGNSFNGDKLRLARLLSGLTQQQLGDAVSVSRQYIHQIEGGTKQPASDVMAALVEALNVEERFFYIPVGNDVKFEQCHFRKRKTTPVGLANRVLAFSTIFEKLVEFIHQHLELPTTRFPNIENAGGEYTNEQIERAAELCRNIWGLGLDTPISRMTRVLENSGVVITYFRGVSDKVDALSVNRKYPIIVRNTAKESVCRMRFDLAHECGHFVLHDGIETGDNCTESEADKFASAFIFPRFAFLKEFPDYTTGRINWNTVYNLKIRWGMSARAIIYRAHSLGRITAQQYRSANVWLNKSGQSRVERHDDKIAPENPELLYKSFQVMREQLGIRFDYIAKELGISRDLLIEITGLAPEDESHLDNVIPMR
jgi:Zn-dependent peptidase ImmA (M78 family)/transcriptional regulator with XRE-family HTH domain